jgi:hypothetical protein
VRAYPDASFGFHGHTDRGLGIANSRAAILAGAVQVQGTLLGTGERCGNVNLTTVIGSMQLRGEAEFVSPESLTGLTSLAHSAYAAFSLEAPHGAPIVGPGAFGTWAGMHGSSERKNPGAYLWCDPAKVGANPVIGVNAQSGRANIVLLSKSLGVPLDSAQAQALMDANQAMIDGGGFTASEVSFRLACMKVLGTLQDRFSVKSWRVLDESDETGNRYVQASMSVVHRRLHCHHHARGGLRPGRCADQGHAAGVGKVVPGHRADAPGHLQRHGHRCIRPRHRGPRPRHRQLPRRRSRAVDHRRSQQRPEPGRADGNRGWFSTTGCCSTLCPGQCSMPARPNAPGARR